MECGEVRWKISGSPWGGGVMSYSGLKSGLALVGLKWPLGKRFPFLAPFASEIYLSNPITPRYCFQIFTVHLQFTSL